MQDIDKLKVSSVQSANFTSHDDHDEESKNFATADLYRTGKTKPHNQSTVSLDGDVNNVISARHSFNKIQVHSLPQLLIQPKLSVNTPGDEYEQEADAMADKIMWMQDGPVKANLSPVKIQRKCATCGKEEEVEEKGETETDPLPTIQRKCAACEEKEEKQLQRKEANNNTPVVSANVQQVIQSQGKPLDQSTRSFMESRFGFDFGKVQIHNDSLAHQSAKDINALAYTHHHHIAFGAGQYQPQTQSGKKLLAHELTHVVQQNTMPFTIVQRQTNPELLEGFERLPESIYVAAKEDFFLMEEPEAQVIPQSKVIVKGDRLELTWKKDTWFYAVSESGQDGYGNASSFIFPPVTNMAKSPTEEFIAVINDTLFIQAKNMHRAFVLARGAKLTPNVGMIFWYSNGKVKPYPVKYEIAIREPSAEEIEKMQQVAGFGGVPAAPGTGTGGGPSTGTSAVPGLVLTPEQERWKEAEKELEPYVLEYLLQESKRVPGEMVMNVPNESFGAMNFKFEEFRVKKNFPFSRDEGSDFVYYYTVFQLLIRAKIKETMMTPYYKPANPVEDVGGLEWYVDSQQKMVEENETYLKTELDKIVAEEQEKRKADIAAFFKPYKDLLDKEQAEFTAKAKERIGKIEGWYNREVEQKAAEKVMELRREEVIKKAEADFATSKIAKELQAAVEKRYAALEKTITQPDPFKDPIIAADTSLVTMIKDFDTKLSAAADYKAKKEIFAQAQRELGAYLLSAQPAKGQSLLRKILTYYSGKLLVNAKGEISVYAIKKWAERNAADVEAVIQKFSPIFHRRFQKDAEQMHLMDMQSMTGAAYVDLGFELLYAKEFFVKVVEHPENDEGFWDGFTSKSLGEFIPFVHSILSISKLYEQMRVANKKLMGGTLTVSEELLLKAVAALHQVNELKKKPFWFRVGEGVADAIPFIGEFIITSPIGLSTGAVAEKVTEAAMKKIAAKYIEKQIVKMIIKGTGVLVGSVFQTLANPLDIMNNIIRYRMHTVGMEVNPDGSITVSVAANKDSEAASIWKGFITSYVNVLTERMGGKLLPFLGSKIAGKFAKFMPMAARSSVFTAYLKSTSEALKKYAGFHGILGEYEEEVYGQVLEALLKGEQLKWSWEDQAQTFMVVAIIGAPVTGAQTMFAAYEIMRTFKFKNKNIVLPASIYTALTRLTSLSAMADFEALLNTEKLTEEQKELAKYLAQKTLNTEHEISLTQQEMIDNKASEPLALPQSVKEMAMLALALWNARKNLVIAKQSGKKVTPESVLLQGEEGTNIPLILHTVEQADKWIYEVESLIASIEGYTMAEMHRIAETGAGMEASIKFWTEFVAGWRPYIAEAKALSPKSIIHLSAEGTVNINANVLVQGKMLTRMLLMDKVNLARLLAASVKVREALEAKTTPDTLSEADAEKLKKVDGNSSVSTSTEGFVDFNSGIQVSPQVLQALRSPVTKGVDNLGEYKFLFNNSSRLNNTPKDYELTEKDKADITALHPGTVLTPVGKDSILLNNQVEVSNTFLKELLLKDMGQLQQLLSLTLNLEKESGDVKKLSESDWAQMQALNRSSGLRLRFRFHYETELQTFINNVGLDKDARFVPLFAKATLEEKVRFWDLYNEIGDFDKKRNRPTDSLPDLRKQASDFALSMNPSNLFEMVDYYQYYLANFKNLVSAGIDAYTQKRRTEQKAEEAKTGSALTDKEKAKMDKLLSKAEFGESFEGVGAGLKSAVSKATLASLAAGTGAASGKVSATVFADLQSKFEATRQAMKDDLGAVKIQPGLSEVEAAKAIRAVSNLSFASETAAVYHVEKHYLELPESLRTANQPAKEYLAVARKAVQDADEISIGYSPIENNVRNFTFKASYTDPLNGKKYELKSIVKELSDGSVFFLTLMTPEKK